jgi:hypothetical protein
LKGQLSEGLIPWALDYLRKIDESNGFFFDPLDEGGSVLAILDSVLEGTITLMPSWEILSRSAGN